MKLYDELVARGLIAQVTDEEQISEMINNGKATFNIKLNKKGSFKANIKFSGDDYYMPSTKTALINFLKQANIMFLMQF